MNCIKCGVILDNNTKNKYKLCLICLHDNKDDLHCYINENDNNEIKNINVSNPELSKLFESLDDW